MTNEFGLLFSPSLLPFFHFRCYLFAQLWNCALNMLWVSERGKFLVVHLIIVLFFVGVVCFLSLSLKYTGIH